MTRIEIIANRSVQDDVVDGLEAAIDGFYYTVVPVVHGRGREARMLGTATWPEENFMLIAYIDEGARDAARAVVGRVKERFPTEGVKLFSVGGASSLG